MSSFYPPPKKNVREGRLRAYLGPVVLLPPHSCQNVLFRPFPCSLHPVCSKQATTNITRPIFSPPPFRFTTPEYVNEGKAGGGLLLLQSLQPPQLHEDPWTFHSNNGSGTYNCFCLPAPVIYFYLFCFFERLPFWTVDNPAYNHLEDVQFDFSFYRTKCSRSLGVYTTALNHVKNDR